MSYSKSPLAFEDVKRILHQALEARKGLRITLPTHSAAVTFRSRCNHYRTRDRQLNRETYPIGHELHLASIYDKLALFLEDCTVTIIKRELIELKVEEVE